MLYGRVMMTRPDYLHSTAVWTGYVVLLNIVHYRSEVERCVNWVYGCVSQVCSVHPDSAAVWIRYVVVLR